MNSGLCRLRLHRLRDQRARDDRRARAGRRDQDVRLDERRVERLPRHGASADRLRERCRMRGRPARDDQPADALRLHVDGGELAHLAGADDEHRAALEVAEDFSRELDGGVADRHRAFGERGLRAHALAGGKRRMKQLVQQRAGAAHLRGDAERVLHLPEYLRLAHDERVEARRDAVQMRDGVLPGLRVEVRRQLVAGECHETPTGTAGWPRAPPPSRRIPRTARRDCRSRRSSLRDARPSPPARSARDRHHGPRSRAALEARSVRCDG